MIVKPPWRAGEATDASSPLPLDTRFRFTAQLCRVFRWHEGIFTIFHISNHFHARALYPYPGADSGERSPRFEILYIDVT